MENINKQNKRKISMAGKPGARDGASNHHSQATGQMEAD